MQKPVHCTDTLMKNIWVCLLRDFRTSLGQNFAKGAYDVLSTDGIKGFRAYKWPARSITSPYFFKCSYQLEALFKRYRFKDDMYTDDELYIKALKGWDDTQTRIGVPLQIKPTTFAVLKRARSIVKSILGEYSVEEHANLCRFGKRACVGTTYRESYLDAKLDRPLTGSKAHIEWFEKNYLPTDGTLSAALRSLPTHQGGVVYEECEALEQSFVPKAWKSLRGIMKNTLLGSFITHGLGRVIQKRLLKVGLDIRRLQQRHQRIVKRCSINRFLATADLSAASDSITVELLMRLLPRKWFRAVMLGRIPYVKTGDSISRMNTVMTMGLGQTFPLQTLVFYSLLVAIEELVEEPKRKSNVSVYGDDLIYPRKIHNVVLHVFPLLHLSINKDKTYAHDFFRESCGADFYRGCDVRPFTPEGESNLLRDRLFGEHLYKLYNGLTRRWDPAEIPITMEYLTQRIVLSQSEILQVPPSFPDGSGVKVERPREDYFFSPVYYRNDGTGWCFKYLHSASRFRIVESLYPYYWEALRSGADTDAPDLVYDDLEDSHVITWKKVSACHKLRPTTKAFRRRLSELYPKTHKWVKQKRVAISVPLVSEKSSSTVRSQTAQVAIWT